MLIEFMQILSGMFFLAGGLACLLCFHKALGESESISMVSFVIAVIFLSIAYWILH